MPLEYFYKFRILIITHKAFYNLGLQEINSLVVRSCKSHNLRKSLNILVNRPNTELGRNSFVHRAAIAWNSLSDSVRSFSNPTGFKNRLKQLKHTVTVLNITFGKDSSVVYIISIQISIIIDTYKFMFYLFLAIIYLKYNTLPYVCIVNFITVGPHQL